jgi:hypothetical protein
VIETAARVLPRPRGEYLHNQRLRTMSFVSLGGTEASRPTFFELVAAERLMPSLKAAAVYSLSVRPLALSVQFDRLASLQHDFILLTIMCEF